MDCYICEKEDSEPHVHLRFISGNLQKDMIMTKEMVEQSGPSVLQKTMQDALNDVYKINY